MLFRSGPEAPIPVPLAISLFSRASKGWWAALSEALHRTGAETARGDPGAGRRMRGAGSRRQPSSQLVRRPKNCTERYPVRARVHLPLSLGMPQPVLDSDPGPNNHPHPRAKRLQSARNCGPEVVARTQRSGSGERDSFYSQLTRRTRDSPKPPTGRQAGSETAV